MNRFTKECWAKILDKETVKDWQINQIWSSKHFKAAKRKQPFSVDSDNNAFSFSLKNEFKFRTINGFHPIDKEYLEDDLEIIDSKLPCTKFYFDESDRVYRPLVESYKLTRIFHRYFFNARQKQALERWAEIKDDLYLPALKRGSEVIPAVLVIGHGDHVYFMHDSVRDLIKIGVSKQLLTRYHAIKNSFNKSEIKILRVISGGGYNLEAALHKHFDEHRVWPRREWFKNHQDIHNFIEKMDEGNSAWSLM